MKLKVSIELRWLVVRDIRLDGYKLIFLDFSYFIYFWLKSNNILLSNKLIFRFITVKHNLFETHYVHKLSDFFLNNFYNSNLTFIKISYYFVSFSAVSFKTILYRKYWFCYFNNLFTFNLICWITIKEMLNILNNYYADIILNN